MRKTTIFLAAVAAFAASAAQAQTDVITGTMQETPTTVVPMNPNFAPAPGSVSVITTLPNIPPGGVITSPGPLPGMPQGNFVTLGAPPPPPSWAGAPGLTQASTTNPNEKYEGRWICRANYGGFWFVGQLRQGGGKNMCQFAFGSQVIRADTAAMLYRPTAAHTRWMSLQGNQVPQGIFMSAVAGEPVRGLPVCRALVQNAMTIGWAARNGCNVVYQDKPVVSKNFEIIALGELMPKPPGQSAPNINLIGVFDVDPTNPTPNKR